MEVTIHHEYHNPEARMRKKLELVRTALRLDKDVLEAMRGEVTSFRAHFSRIAALALERAATLEADNAQRFAMNAVVAAGLQRDAAIIRTEAESARDAAGNATRARTASEAAFAAMRAAQRAQLEAEAEQRRRVAALQRRRSS